MKISYYEYSDQNYHHDSVKMCWELPKSTDTHAEIILRNVCINPGE